MICESCQKHEVSVHVTLLLEVVEPEGPEQTIQEQHLCEVCAQVAKLPGNAGGTGTIGADIWKILQYSAQQVQQKRPTIQCPDCKMSLEELRRKGRLGCPKDYEVFKEYLDDLLERMHGARRHVGRLPGIPENEMVRIQRMTDLRGELELAIREEAYERAAALRDELKNLESEQEAGS